MRCRGLRRRRGLRTDGGCKAAAGRTGGASGKPGGSGLRPGIDARERTDMDEANRYSFGITRLRPGTSRQGRSVHIACGLVAMLMAVDMATLVTAQVPGASKVSGIDADGPVVTQPVPEPLGRYALFGVAESPRDTPPPAAALKPSARPQLRLTGTLAGAGHGLALISVGGQAEQAYPVGGTLASGWRLTAVFADRVQIAGFGESIEVPMPAGESALARTSAPRDPAPAVSGVPAFPAVADDHEFSEDDPQAGSARASGRQERTPVDARPIARRLRGAPQPDAALRQLAGFDPVSLADHHGYGLRLRLGPESYLLTRAGLREGDVIVAIGGVLLQDGAQARQLAMAALEATELELRLLRENEELTMDFDLGRN